MTIHEHEVFRTPEDELRMRNFAFFSANLHKLMPDIPYGKHKQLFNEAGQYKRLATDESLCQQWLASVEFECLCALADAKPGIIATYHTGPYRLLPMWMARQGTPFTLLVSADVEESQGESYRDWYRLVTKEAKAGGFSMLQAEDPLVLRKMIRALRGGHHIVVYVDGNTGSGQWLDRTGLEIGFLAHRIRIRAGVAHLARMAQVPVYPMGSLFNGQGDPAFNVFPPIHPQDIDGDRNAQATETMRRIYGPLEELIHKAPMQWEGWFYVHGDIARDGIAPDKELLRFYLPFKINGQGFLLHKDSLTAYRLPQRLYDWLSRKVSLP